MATSETSFTARLLACTLALAPLTLAPMLAGCDGGTTTPTDVYANLGISLSNLDGGETALVSKTDKDLHVLAFWATWCIPCTGELAKMQGIHDRLSPRGLNIYAISIDGPDTISRVPGFAAQEKWTFPVLYDPETTLLARYNPKGDIPFYVILDADGNIIQSHQGYNKGDEIQLEQFLVEHLPAE